MREPPRRGAPALVASGVFAVAAAAVLVVAWADRRPEPIYPDRFPHDDAPAVFVTARLPLEVEVTLPRAPEALRVPVWVGPDRRALTFHVARVARPESGTASAPVRTRVAESGLARVAVPRRSAGPVRLRITITSAATSRDGAPRVLWSRDPPLRSLAVRYAGRSLEDVEVLPGTGPLLIAEYPWPSRWLLWLWAGPVVLAVPAWRRGERARHAFAVAIALAATATSVLLWQRDYTGRAAHVDADRYAESARRMAAYVARPEERPAVAYWLRHHPHATTALVPAVLVPFVLAGVPASLAFAWLSALACWLALLLVRDAAGRALGVSSSIAWATAAAFACHPVLLRSFARPVTDGIGLLLVLVTLALLVRRLSAAGARDEILLAGLVLLHPLARPQGFGYWPFVAVALLLADRARDGAWPGFRVACVRQLRVFAAPVAALLVLYAGFDWWHNVGLMLEKARRFRIDSTPGDFLAACAGVLQLVPVIGLLAMGRRGETGDLRGTTASAAVPGARTLLVAWALFATALLVAVRAPFWLRHFLPVLPVPYWLAARWIDPLRGVERALGLGMLAGPAVAGAAVTIWQVFHLAPLPAWLAAVWTVP